MIEISLAEVEAIKSDLADEIVKFLHSPILLTRLRLRARERGGQEVMVDHQAHRLALKIQMWRQDPSSVRSSRMPVICEPCAAGVHDQCEGSPCICQHEVLPG